MSAPDVSLPSPSRVGDPRPPLPPARRLAVRRPRGRRGHGGGPPRCDRSRLSGGSRPRPGDLPPLLSLSAGGPRRYRLEPSRRIPSCARERFGRRSPRRHGVHGVRHDHIPDERRRPRTARHRCRITGCPPLTFSVFSAPPWWIPLTPPRPGRGRPLLSFSTEACRSVARRGGSGPRRGGRPTGRLGTAIEAGEPPSALYLPRRRPVSPSVSYVRSWNVPPS